MAITILSSSIPNIVSKTHFEPQQKSEWREGESRDYYEEKKKKKNWNWVEREEKEKKKGRGEKVVRNHHAWHRASFEFVVVLFVVAP